MRVTFWTSRSLWRKGKGIRIEKRREEKKRKAEKKIPGRVASRGRGRGAAGPVAVRCVLSVRGRERSGAAL